MNPDDRPSRAPRNSGVLIFTVLVALSWVGVITCFILWDLGAQERMIFELATAEARASFNTDLAYRRWLAFHGGAYVPATAHTPPNPNLAHITDRDIITPSGIMLTLVNPAYMTRQVHELYQGKNEYKGHITSLKPLRKKNHPDAWEFRALQAFERGQKEIREVAAFAGKPHLRLMRPMITEQRCLKCHAQQGYKLGDIRGGISVSIALEPLKAIAGNFARTTILFHLVAGLLGLVGIAAGGISFHRKNLHRNAVSQALWLNESRLNEAQSVAQVANWERDLETGLEYWSDQMHRLFGHEPGEIPGDEKSLLRFLANQDASEVAEAWNRCLSTGQGFERDVRYSPRQGGDRHAHLICRVSLGPNGSPRLLRGTLQDITQRKQAEEALKASEERSRRILMTTMDGFWRTDSRGRILEVNQSYCRMSGYTRRELLQMRMSDLEAPENRAAIAGRMETLALKGSDRFEAVHRRKDQSLYDVEVSVQLLGSESDGQCVVFIRDISERKKAEQEQLRNAKDLRESQRIAHLGSWRLDLSSNEVHWTEELYRMYGFDPSLAPPPFTEHKKLFTPESWELLSTSLANTIDTGLPYELELETVRQDGSLGWMWVRGETVCDDQGRTTGLWGAAQDITDRKMVEKALAERQEKFYSLFNFMSELAVLHELVFDQNGKPVDYRILDCNLAFGKITGLSRDKAIGALASDLYGTPQAPYLEIYAQTALSGEPARFETYFESMNKHFSISVSATGRGRFVTIAEDITQAKVSEEEKARLESQLIQAQKMEALGTLAGGIAHDFNNILAAIIGYSELALEDANRGECDPWQLEQIINAGERAKDLVTQILTFSRKLTPELKATDLNRVIKQTGHMLERTIPKMVEIRQHLGRDLRPINADPGQMAQVLMNLCSNASDAMPDGGRLIIETENMTLDQDYAGQHAETKAGDYVLLTVSDTGHGMDEQTMSHIFDPFFTRKEVGKGTGLGLSTVYGIVKNHGGHVTCYSEPGQGTSFKVFLPAASPNLVEKAPHRGSGQEGPGGRETILMVDDDEQIRNLGATMLSQRGYRVLSAENGEQALALCRERKRDVDLVILDINMPGMGGYKCLEKLHKEHPELPVIVSSGYSRHERQEDMLTQGASGFIPKPYRKAEMLQTVRQVLDA